MLYLITGTNGAGKTLNALKWIRERSLKESRPVCHNGRFEPVPGGELADWKHIDIKSWQDEPDGTIFLVDECHNDFPLRAPSSAPPDYVKMLAEHRRRGFDFYLITQHPQNIDAFVRRLIGSPGWHRHLKRTFGGDLVSCIEWAAVNPNCEKDGSGKTGTVTMIPFPKDVYGWYKSASLHTAKRRIPWRVWLFVACAVIAPLLIFLAFNAVGKNLAKNSDVSSEIKKPADSLPSPSAPAPASVTSTSAEQYVLQRLPRLPDFPHTAPVYDEVTKPVHAPYPAACVQSSSVCKCYTQQGTLLRVDVSVCVRIVAEGFFIDWDRGQLPQQQASRQNSSPQPTTPPVQLPAQPPVLVAAAPTPTPPKEPGYLESLRLRNAEVRSVLQR
ncbi:MAG: zonular occludens toxin domain-containing protein [Giesbergeria sp.]|uniref:zonular occludens toxin domain-containing protein n=1 Tax=Giesbergeria sp. TaxID=2818473 RepID=UPI00261CB5D3|nr:zonular occludens toxin domain-containing protein [Giesbergeria sp.]MDD2609520.1 zonular occludens toxin domain-containing protein [Giesbergeria sp.]